MNLAMQVSPEKYIKSVEYRLTHTNMYKIALVINKINYDECTDEQKKTLVNEDMLNKLKFNMAIPYLTAMQILITYVKANSDLFKSDDAFRDAFLDTEQEIKRLQDMDKMLGLDNEMVEKLVNLEL